MTPRFSRLAAATALFLACAIPVCVAATPAPPMHFDPASGDSLGLVPEPQSVVVMGPGYTLPATVAILATTPAQREIAAGFADFLKARGQGVVVVASGAATVRLIPDNESDAGAPTADAYKLAIFSDGIVVKSNTDAGMFYGVQTLEQIFAVRPQADEHLPGVEIVDSPQYHWRGIHLDVSRHFFSVAVVKRYIDLAARYKLNVFHWHLTDDQGWRIEIKAYPKLTEDGSCRPGSEVGNDDSTVDHTPVCGFYTQAQIRDVVAYAAKRYITVLPEIEMPGHAVAALAKYPWLACTPGPFRVRETWGVSTDIICPTERTFAFEERVLDEVMALFPSRYIHIGGDEVPTDAWKHSAFVHQLMTREHITSYAGVQGYFTRRIERYLIAHGRRMIGWDEILDGGVSANATVMSWRGTDGGVAAAERGNDVVMSPDGPLYIDWVQGDAAYEPVGIDGLSTPQMIYDFNPTPSGLDMAQQQHVLGVQANLWTERIPTADHLFYMLLPRELALAEVAWSAPVHRVWSEFVARSAKQYAWLEANHIPFRLPDPTARVIGGGDTTFESVHRSVNETELRISNPTGTLALGDDVADAVIHYTTDDSVPTATAPVYSAPIPFDLTVNAKLHLRAIAMTPDGRASAPTTITLRR